MHIVNMVPHKDCMFIMADSDNDSRNFLHYDLDVNVHCSKQKHHFVFLIDFLVLQTLYVGQGEYTRICSVFHTFLLYGYIHVKSPGRFGDLVRI